MRVSQLHETGHDVKQMGPGLLELYRPETLLPDQGPDDVSQDGAQHVQLRPLHTLQTSPVTRLEYNVSMMSVVRIMSDLRQTHPDPLGVAGILLDVRDHGADGLSV